MGTWTELQIGPLSVFASKSAPSPVVMTLFRSADRTFVRREDEDEGDVVSCVYGISAALAKQRLHVMGFTLEEARASYEKRRERAIEQFLEDFADEHEVPGTWEHRELQVMKSVGFDAFLDACRKAFRLGFRAYERPEGGYEDPVLDRIATSDMDYEWGFYCDDPRSFIRALLEAVPDETPVVVDVSDLINNGYFEPDDDFVALALADRRAAYAVDSPIIVLTEGVTDAEVLSRSMALLYSPLRDYYRFLDHSARPSGGASQLVNALRAFVAAGIENRIVAVFDNDAEGRAALQLLRRQDLPSNVRVMTLPDIALARSYPTDGPNGGAVQDVNGLAASIELYFGEDVLRDPAARLAVVSWKARNETIGRYQGEVQRKDELKQRFLAKLARCELDPSAIVEDGWREMREILQRIFRAFEPTC